MTLNVLFLKFPNTIHRAIYVRGIFVEHSHNIFPEKSEEVRYGIFPNNVLLLPNGGETSGWCILTLDIFTRINRAYSKNTKCKKFNKIETNTNATKITQKQQKS